jgi:hypothetical protein
MMGQDERVMAGTGDAKLREICEKAARGAFPPPAWGLELLPGPERVVAAVLAFTGHHIVAADIDEDQIRRHLDRHDVAAPFNPVFLAWIGERLEARVGHIDVTMSRFGSGPGDDWLRPVAEPPDNERVRRARQLRSEISFLSPPDRRAVVSLGLGLAGRHEVSMEVGDESDRSQGLGTRLVLAAVARVPADTVVFAGVAPGNARSLRCLLRAGFRPIGAECIFTHE